MSKAYSCFESSLPEKGLLQRASCLNRGKKCYGWPEGQLIYLSHQYIRIEREIRLDKVSSFILKISFLKGHVFSSI